MKTRFRIGAALFAACVLLFIILAALLPDTGPLPIDTRAADAVHKLAGRQGEDVWKSVTELGSSTVIIAAALLYTAWLGLRLRTAAVLWIPVGGIVAYGLNQLLKGWIDRPRPTGAWGIEFDGASFPSGNAMLAMAVYGTIVVSFLLYAKAGRLGQSTAAVVGVVVIASVGFSRLFFGVHYLTDIVAGYAAGAAVLLVVLWLLGTALNQKEKI